MARQRGIEEPLLGPDDTDHKGGVHAGASFDGGIPLTPTGGDDRESKSSIHSRVVSGEHGLPRKNTDSDGESSSGGAAAAARSYSGGFSIVGPWEESRDIITTLGAYDPQFSGAMAGTALEMAGMDRYMQLQQDQVPFKVRAKRGCATHPRSIAERERRTRISEKLRKLQDLVPNMDKQTSTADMLDLAVEHIKGLQSELQALKHEQEKCTCCRKR